MRYGVLVGGLPNSVNGKVPPRRIPNKQRRTREYLTEREVDRLIDAARKAGRYGHRDATLILLAIAMGCGWLNWWPYVGIK